MLKEGTDSILLIYALIVVISLVRPDTWLWIQIQIRMGPYFSFCFDMDPYLRNLRGSGSGSRKMNLYLNEFWEIR